MKSLSAEEKKRIQPFLLKKLPQIKRICRQHKVKRLYIFGSVCTNFFNENSDIDFIIAFEPRFFDGYVDNFLSLEENLKKLLQRNIDLVAEECLQNPYFIKVVNQTKIKIYD